ncbi:MAG: hypothetical protein HUK02_01380 [Bacteroidaceae bacterium]|nr:hypothetical protein [Bacteroidaceae bacterium]
MNKNLKQIVVVLSALFFVGCSNDVDDISVPSYSAESSTSEKITSKNLQAIASLLASLPIDNETCREVKTTVETALFCGIEESAYFQEILSEQTKISTRSLLESRLGRLLHEHYRNTRASAEDADMVPLSVLENSGRLQIYWPYSEDWDGVSMPAITFAPEDESQLWNIAFVKDNERIDTIVVDEEYMQNHPVWIVNLSEIRYEDLPDFSSGQYVANSCAFVGQGYVATHESHDTPLASQSVTRSTRSDNNLVYTVQLGSFMSDHQYDSVWAGGSEFIIQMGSLDRFEISSNSQLTVLDPEVTYIRINRSRKDIKNQRWWTDTSVLNFDWTPNENDAAFMIHEEDGGDAVQWEADLSLTWGGAEYGFKVNLPYKNKDELIYKIVYKRDYVFSNSNYNAVDGWTINSSGGVHWTMPYVIGNVL